MELDGSGQKKRTNQLGFPLFVDRVEEISVSKFVKNNEDVWEWERG